MSFLIVLTNKNKTKQGLTGTWHAAQTLPWGQMNYQDFPRKGRTAVPKIDF